ncbi:glycosyltransferase 87 family protein [Pseudarthrobacter sp. J64]|uniref:glycosyltransferase family 87 protein n=1 Tax=Pseudarthrobacter sp. J64 TaxID=3116485 RepID=UPI002E8113E2|nr:glycosyltransferase 87 family protein [Pseudarthrobacter sp. J64]MEE2570051.1 glycosyltransferase 87 family protein [Pseudarthrobacter sp. J64]
MQHSGQARQRQRGRLVVPSRSDLFLRKFTESAGGPLGRHSAPGLTSPGVFTVERVLILLTLAAALAAVVLKGYCRANGWDTPGQFYATCYSDFPEMFRSRGLAEGNLPFFTAGARIEYPVLIALIAGVSALLVPRSGPQAAPTATDDRILAYFDVNATLVIAVWIVTVIATARMTRRRPWDAAMVAVAPGMVLAGLINWDMWAVALLALGMYFFSRERLVLAGILIGLGISTKLYPVLIFGAILLLAIRTARYKPLLVTGAATAGSWLVVNLPFALTNFDAWSYFFQFSQDRPAGYSSPWFAYNLAAGRFGWAALGPDTINVMALWVFIIACALIALVALTAPRRPRLAQLAFLIVAAFLLTNKVYSPQFVLWLIPLVALARPKWRDFLVWQGIEALHWAAIWLYLAQVTSNGPSQNNLDMPYYVLAVLAHMVATAYLMARVVQEIYDPGLDPIRRHGMDDPQGGPFEDAPDRFRLNGSTLNRPWLSRPTPDRPRLSR